MLRVSPKLFLSRTKRPTLFAGALIFVALAPVTLRAQRPKAALDSDMGNRPTFSQFKGVPNGGSR